MTETDQILERISRETDHIKSISVKIGEKLDAQTSILSKMDDEVVRMEGDIAIASIPTPSRGRYLGVACLSICVIASSIVAPVIGPIVVTIPVAGYALYRML
jgi:hypothetical protein